MAKKTETSVKKTAKKPIKKSEKIIVKKSKIESKVKEKKQVKKVIKKSIGKETKSKSLNIPIVGLDGKSKGKMNIPEELFAAKVNAVLLAQAVRVYRTNQRQGSASTKSRGEVVASKRKVWKQKGTGRARHGSVNAPIFVGGGITFGPKPKDYAMSFPKKMKRKALASALTSKYENENVVIIDGLDTVKPKTKDFYRTISLIVEKKSCLLVLPEKIESVLRGTNNIQNVDTILAKNLHTYALLSHVKILIMKPAIEVLSKTFIK
ncbi:50S ribosomal protein L4 [Patescibacteria group bacterium]